MQVKGNQEKLLRGCEKIVNSYNPTDVFTSDNMGHGRSERRRCLVFDREHTLDRYLPMQWRGLVQSVVIVERDRCEHIKGKWFQSSREVSYYVFTKRIAAKEAEKLIRDHWMIENSQNYVRDVSMGEDRSRIRMNPQNMMTLRSFALNTLRYNGIENVATAMYENSLSLDRILNLNSIKC